LAQSALVSNWNQFRSGLLDYNQLNAIRSNNLYGVDFRLDYKWYLPKWSFNLYLDIQNIPGVAGNQPTLLLDQGVDGNDPIVVLNEGTPQASYKVKEISSTIGVVTPTIGIIVQF
jgi:hypothetical protein